MIKKILVVDDEPHIVELLKINLKEDYNVITAFDGYQAIETAKSEFPDLIILDIMLPSIDGYSVLEKIRNDEAFVNIPIIILSAKAFKPEDADNFTFYISKPFSPLKLKALIRKIFL